MTVLCGSVRTRTSFIDHIGLICKLISFMISPVFCTFLVLMSLELSTCRSDQKLKHQFITHDFSLK